MYRVTKFINKEFKNVYDSVRFMPQSKRRNLYFGFAGFTTLTATGVYTLSQTIFLEGITNLLTPHRYELCIPRNIFFHVDFHLSENNYGFR